MSTAINTTKINIIGEQIKRYRRMINMSQIKLSEELEKIGIYTCRCSISRIESGRRAVTDIEVDGISKVLNISLDQLFGRKK